MQLISCHDGKLQKLSDHWGDGEKSKTFATGLEALDALAPGGALARGAIHEVLSEPTDGVPRSFALVLANASSSPSPFGGQAERTPARSARVRDWNNASSLQFPTLSQRQRGKGGGAIVWCDLRAELYPPAVAAMGIRLDRLFLLRPKYHADQIWAIAECLRCRGVGAVIAPVAKLSRVEARRIQLAAERGGGVGILLRPARGAGSAHYAAATRWLVRPARGQRTVQRWTIQLIHGHGGRVGQTVFLEVCRETRRMRIEAHPVRAPEELADRPAAAPQTTRVPA